MKYTTFLSVDVEGYEVMFSENYNFYPYTLKSIKFNDDGTKDDIPFDIYRVIINGCDLFDLYRTEELEELIDYAEENQLNINIYDSIDGFSDYVVEAGDRWTTADRYVHQFYINGPESVYQDLGGW